MIGKSDINTSPNVQKFWQARRDLNPDKQYQKLLCYHYTTGLRKNKLSSLSRWRQGVIRA